MFEKGTACNSLAWSTLPTDFNEADGKNKKKKRKRLSTTYGDPAESGAAAVLAMGMSKGSILLYSPTEGAVVGSLDGGHIGEVTDFKFSGKTGRGWSCGTDGKLVEWDLKRRLAITYVQFPNVTLPVALLMPFHYG